MEITKKQILEQKKLLNEDGWENALMVAGFIPVIGEVADIALICLYLYRKEYLYAGLMLIALIPTVGDFIAKPFITLLKGYGAVGKTALKSADDMAKFLMENPKAKANFLKMSEHFDNRLIQETNTRFFQDHYRRRTCCYGCKKFFQRREVSTIHSKNRKISK